MSSMQIEGRHGKPVPALIKPQNQETDAVAVPFPEEIVHLEKTLKLIKETLQETAGAVERYDREYMESKRYMVMCRGEIDPKEIFQNELLLKGIERSGIHAVKVRDKLIKMLDSPYFARIDFRPEGASEPDIFYIGRFHFSRDGELLIYDWRAPVSGMFYDCELGKAEFAAPVGKVEGEITRRRQFKISGGKMEYALESSLRIGDDILQKELGNTSDEKMRNIIATLQREQNQIIRNEKAETLIIQGVAGSGKTSVALHRIAYLLYRHKETLTAKNVVILSPNRVFGDYISNVLPELGEEPVYEVSFTDLAEVQLDRTIGFEKEADSFGSEDPACGERTRLKSSLLFLKQLKAYLEQAAAEMFQATDYTAGYITVQRQWLMDRYRAYRELPVLERLKEIAADLRDRLESENYMSLDLPKTGTILKDLRRMLKVKNTLGLYREFYRSSGMAEMFVMPGRKTLEWADVYPFLYCRRCFEGLRENRLIRHLVVDEMQDYTPVQYAVLELMFRCKMTILGDFGQSVNPYSDYTLQDLQELFPQSETAVLRKSYRSTYEIITFAGRIQNEAEIEPVKRHGEAPQIISCRDREEELNEIEGKLDEFLNGDFATLGIITKNKTAALELYEKFSGQYPVRLITPESKSFSRGISIVTVQMAKGLEFDEVLIPSADCETYNDGHDRNLLYVACTRAMHRLTLLYSGQLSGWIGQKD